MRPRRRKRFRLPNGLWLAANAGVQHIGTSWRQSIRDQFHPFVGAFLQLGGGPTGDDVVLGGAGGLSWKQRIPVPMRLTGIRGPKAAVEVRGGPLMLVRAGDVRLRCPFCAPPHWRRRVVGTEG